MRGLGGTATEPIVIEMSDEAGVLVHRAVGCALTHGVWTEEERKGLEALRDGLVRAGVNQALWELAVSQSCRSRLDDGRCFYDSTPCQVICEFPRRDAQRLTP